jgi:hypothetical protein
MRSPVLRLSSFTGNILIMSRAARVWHFTRLKLLEKRPAALIAGFMIIHISFANIGEYYFIDTAARESWWLYGREEG